MTSEREFHQAVQADPESDLPRQLLADWYEENGQTDRAAFIRLQLQAANPNLHPIETDRINAACHKLLQRHQADWLPPTSLAKDMYLHRGLPEGLQFPKNLKLQNARAWFRRAKEYNAPGI